MQNHLIHLQENKTRKYWEQIQDELKNGHVEVETWSLEPRTGHFYARAVSDRIFIEGKGIKGIRTIRYEEFEKAAAHYNDYVNEVPGTKQKLRDEVGYNTTYILTFIHRALEEESKPKAEAEPEPEPVSRKVAPVRVRHYRSRRGG
jgi:hypothetical protein